MHLLRIHIHDTHDDLSMQSQWRQSYASKGLNSSVQKNKHWVCIPRLCRQSPPPSQALHVDINAAYAFSDAYRQDCLDAEHSC